MHVYPAALLGASLWLVAFVTWPGLFMVLIAPLFISATVLAAALLAGRQ